MQRPLSHAGPGTAAHRRGSPRGPGLASEALAIDELVLDAYQKEQLWGASAPSARPCSASGAESAVTERDAIAGARFLGEEDGRRGSSRKRVARPSQAQPTQNVNCRVSPSAPDTRPGIGLRSAVLPISSIRRMQRFPRTQIADRCAGPSDCARIGSAGCKRVLCAMQE